MNDVTTQLEQIQSSIDSQPDSNESLSESHNQQDDGAAVTSRGSPSLHRSEAQDGTFSVIDFSTNGIVLTISQLMLKVEVKARNS